MEFLVHCFYDNYNYIYKEFVFRRIMRFWVQNVVCNKNLLSWCVFYMHGWHPYVDLNTLRSYMKEKKEQKMTFMTLLSTLVWVIVCLSCIVLSIL